MNKSTVIVQDLSKEDFVLKVVIRIEDSYCSFKNKVAEYLSMDTRDFLLYSEGIFMDDEQTVDMSAVAETVYAIPQKHIYTLVSGGSQKRVPIKALSQKIETRALEYAKGIKARNQSFSMERQPSISFLS